MQGDGAQQSPGHGACHHTHAETSALHHYVPDLHRRMLLATLWNTYICINEALTVFIRLWEAEYDVPIGRGADG